jgi:hypothetical protein
MASYCQLCCPSDGVGCILPDVPSRPVVRPDSLSSSILLMSYAASHLSVSVCVYHLYVSVSVYVVPMCLCLCVRVRFCVCVSVCLSLCVSASVCLCPQIQVKS